MLVSNILMISFTSAEDRKPTRNIWACENRL